jgi:hypothetical protein
MEPDQHETYGVERACGECGGPTIVAMNHTSSATEPTSVQARCRKLSCMWKGQLVTVTPGVGRREPPRPPPKPPPTNGELF